MATLAWTSPRFKNLPEKLFIQSADDSLSFLATADTFGTYHCEAEEGGYKEVVASYGVRQIAPPRSIIPFPKTDESHEAKDEDESYEQIEEPFTSMIPPSGEPEESATKDEGDTLTINLKDETVSNKVDFGLNNFQDNGLDFTPTSRTDSQSRKEPLGNPPVMTRGKSYHSELVVVSLLLVASICLLILGGLHMWRQRKTESLKMKPLMSREVGSRTNQSMESVPSLSSPEDAGPELKVMQ